MRELILDSLADMRFGLLLVVVMALLAGCQGPTGGDMTGRGTSAIDIAGPTTRTADLGWSEPIHFDTDRSALRPEDKPVVARVAALLAKFPQTRVVIEGHADERGTREYNLALGQRRGEAYRTALIAAGVPAGRIADVESYGKERPAMPGNTEAAWAANRRALVVPQ